MDDIINRKPMTNPIVKSLSYAFGLFMLLILLLMTVYIVDDGEVGVKKTLGHINDDEVLTGISIVMPFVQSIEIYDVKTQEIKESAAVPSSEGLIIQLDTSVIYHLEPTKVAELRKMVNANYEDTLLIPYIRNTVRDIVAGYEAKTIYSESGRKEVALNMKSDLEDKLSSRGIVIEDVLLRDIQLPNNVKEAIELKLQKEQESQRKEFELIAAQKDAEIEVARAKGVSEANKIIANSITPEYIRYLWVQALSDETNQVIYVPTEANLPILEASRLK